MTEAPSGLRKMLAEANIDDLKRAYNLFRDHPEAFQSLQDSVFSFIISSVNSILTSHDQPISQKVHSLYSLNTSLRHILVSAFFSDRKLEETLNHSFDKAFSTQGTLGQLLAVYVDIVMTKEIKQLADAEIDTILDNFMSIFRFIRERDVFEAINKSLFAKRLLMQTSLNNEAEKGLLRRLRMECGPAYTRKIEGMMTDIETARTEPMQLALSHSQIEVLVLKSVYWPSDSLEPALMPAELGPLVTGINEEYHRRFPQRLLDWKTNYGTAEVVGRFGERSYEFMVSTYQMLILMYFNTVQKVTYSELGEALGIKFDKDLPKHVFGLIAAKLLLKSTSTKQLEPDCELSISSTYENKLRRIKISVLVPKQKDKPVVTPATPSDVLETRKFLTDMAIVRVMKARRVLETALLIAEVIRQLSSKFPPEPKDIKARVESLVEREYLRALEDGKYEYMA